MDLFFRSWRLVPELVAREIQDLKALVLQLFIHSFKGLIVRCESAACGCIYDEQDFAFVLCKICFVSRSVFYFEIIYC